MKTFSCLLSVAFAVSFASAQEESLDGMRVQKAIPIEKIESGPAPVTAFNAGGVSITVDPAQATSQTGEGSLTNSLQQQMHLAVFQALAPWLSLAYAGGLGFQSQEIQLLRQPDQSSANLTLLNRPALTWKPRPGIEIEAAYEDQQALNPELSSQSIGTAILQGKMTVSPRTTLGAAYRDQKNIAYSQDESEMQSLRLTSEYAFPEQNVTLQINPGYENATAPDRNETLRSFVENAVIWKVNPETTLTLGGGVAGGRNAPLSQSTYMLVQYVVMPRTALELRAAMLTADRTMPGSGFAVSAGSTVALAQALSAGLSLRYKMDETPTVARPQSETFLSLSINGKF